MSFIKLFIVLVLLVIVASLGSALFHMMRGSEQSRRKMARALTVRIGLSISLLLFMILAVELGWITPHGVVPGGGF